MKVFSGIVMLLGLVLGGIILIDANSAPQEAIALVPIVGGYVTGRMFENFSTSYTERIHKLLDKKVEG